MKTPTLNEIITLRTNYINTRTHTRAEIPYETKKAIIVYVDTQLQTSKSLDKIMRETGFSTKGSGATTYLKICRQALVEPSQLYKKQSTAKQIKTFNFNLEDEAKKYINPQIHKHLKAAQLLIEEEQLKMVIYNEMKTMMKH